MLFILVTVQYLKKTDPSPTNLKTDSFIQSGGGGEMKSTPMLQLSKIVA